MSLWSSAKSLASSALDKGGSFLSSYGGILGTLASSAADIAGQTGWLSYSSAKSLNKRTLEQQLAASKELALNAPSWNVEGLRNAGINPILVATGGNLSNVSLPNGSIGSGGSSLHLPNVANEVLNNKILKANLGVADEQKNYLIQQIKNLQSDKELTDAKTKATLISAANSRASGDEKEWFTRLAHRTVVALSDLFNFSTPDKNELRQESDLKRFFLFLFGARKVKQAASSAFDASRRVKVLKNELDKGIDSASKILSNPQTKMAIRSGEEKARLYRRY